MIWALTPTRRLSEYISLSRDEAVRSPWRLRGWRRSRERRDGLRDAGGRDFIDAIKKRGTKAGHRFDGPAFYDGEGEKKLNAGDVHLLPAGIKHAVTGWSRDLEMLETTHPADYQSIELTDAQIARLG